MKTFYRSDVQGLRVIAVLLVFFSHADVNILRGGFVGVDVFFVISGYVITHSLLVRHFNTAILQFIPFYLDRLKRLVPALLVML